MTGLKKYFRNQIFENVVLLRISPSQISPYFHYISCIIHIIYFLQTEHLVLFVAKNFEFECSCTSCGTIRQSRCVCHKISIIRFNIIMKVRFLTDTIFIKNQRNRSIAIKSFIGLWKRRQFF